MMVYHDDNGYRIKHGDRLNFAYGIPPTGVWGIVERINGAARGMLSLALNTKKHCGTRFQTSQRRTHVR